MDIELDGQVVEIGPCVEGFETGSFEVGEWAGTFEIGEEDDKR